VNKDEVRPSDVLEIFRSIKKPSLSIQVEVVIKNRTFPEPMSINHEFPSKACNAKV
jgi:hypothetical protein